MRQGTPEWHTARAERLTASDFGAALGINPFCSRQKLWRIKMGLESVEENEHIRRGVEGEQHAIWAYQVDRGVLVDEVGLVVHTTEPWLACSPDGLVGADGLVEIKCPAAFRDAPPAYHMAQMQGQLEITGRAWCDYAQWCDGELVVMRVERDRDWWATSMPGLREFWDCVLRMEQPKRRRST